LHFSLLEPRGTYCSPGNFACSDGNNAISLVTLFGEPGTQIQDDMKKCSPANNYNDRSNLVVTLMENTLYTLHIEFYCVQSWGYENSYNQDPYFSQTSCNHAQYLGVWIDFNNDGTFDESREMIPNNRYTNNQRMTAYDLSLVIPNIDGRNYLNEQHRMRIVLTQDERNLKPCYGTGYGEVRDYTVQIIPKPVY
jgi:hypothetical protein